MATPKQISQRLGWAVAQEGNAHDAVTKMREHLEIAMADLEAWIADPEPEPDPPPPEPEPEPLTPGVPGTPKFSQVNGSVLVSWEPAARATRYYYSHGAESPAEWGGTTTATSVTLTLTPGDEVCVIAENEHGMGTMACAVYVG